MLALKKPELGLLQIQPEHSRIWGGRVEWQKITAKESADLSDAGNAEEREG